MRRDTCTTKSASSTALSMRYRRLVREGVSIRMFDDDDERVYQVVINDEEQYSIWPADREVPAGWRATGPSGVKSECLAYIDQVWTDMRPRSVRLAMERRS